MKRKIDIHFLGVVLFGAVILGIAFYLRQIKVELIMGEGLGFWETLWYMFIL